MKINLAGLKVWPLGDLRPLSRLKRQGERGQSLVEFALVLPVVILVLFGILDLGRVMDAYILVTHGAREGARQASLGETEATVVTKVRAAVPTLTPLTVTCPSCYPSGSSGDPVTVTVTYSIQIMTPIISAFFPQNPVPLSVTVTMRRE